MPSSGSDGGSSGTGGNSIAPPREPSAFDVFRSYNFPVLRFLARMIEVALGGLLVAGALSAYGLNPLSGGLPGSSHVSTCGCQQQEQAPRLLQ
jgi:hypothetical protein